MPRSLLGYTLLGGLAVCWLVPRGVGHSTENKDDLASRLRRPVALVLADEGKWLFTANRRSGTVSVIDTQKLQNIAEITVGRALADLAVAPDGKHLLAVDEHANELIVLARRGPSLEIAHRMPVSPAPVSVSVAPDGARCFVASLWSRRLTVIDLGKDDAKPSVRHTVALPFAPRKQLPAADTGRLLVADSFGGRLAVVDVEKGALASVREVPGHNVRGLAWSIDGKRLLLAHQRLSARAHTTRDDIHWGNLITNNLRELPRPALLDRDADLLRDGRLYPLGEVTRGAADPTGLALRKDGTVLVALAGTDELLLNAAHPDGPRLAVGRRPTAVVVSPDDRRAFVANTFADSVSVVDLAARKVHAEVSLGPKPELTAADRGELAFHDARLSHDRWLSCHSCHTDGHTSGQLNDNLADGSYGAPKRILSLLGVRDTGPWSWNGSKAELKDLIRQSLRTTMRGPEPTDERVADLEAFLRTLAPPSPVALPSTPDEQKAVARGKDVFHNQGCVHCHTPPTYTSPKTYDVGLSDDVGNTEFNPPSLRGVSQGGPYFHDNRAATLEEVFTRHRHRLKADLTKEELTDLLAFLRSL
jgi:YVTN family beta-propeller protein